MKEILSPYIQNVMSLLEWLEKQSHLLESIGKACLDRLKEGGALFFCGNGGSASEGHHIAAELMGRFERQDRRPFPAISLATNPALLTALSNDYEFDQIFARQIQALVGPKDVLIVTSTSGSSPNILKAIEAGKDKKALLIGFTGLPGTPLKERVDLLFQVPSSRTSHIQELHFIAWHCLCKYLEEQW